MTYRGYSEAELLSNRASLLLFGGSAEDRRAWAQEVQQRFAAEGPLKEVARPEELSANIATGKGVVYLPDALALGRSAQGELLLCLHREERPKLVVGLSTSPGSAQESGLLRSDLAYRLQLAQVDLGVEAVRQAIRRRRAAAPSPKGRPARKPARKAAGRR